MKKSIKDLGDIKGKRALVRVDINVVGLVNHTLCSYEYLSKSG